MIPKRLFFIWLGNVQPPYVNHCINSFKKNNPDFEINFIRYTLDDVDNIDKKNICKFDKDLINTISCIKEESKYTKIIRDYKKSGRKFYQIVGNILRYELIFNYGGIYLDCDTYSIKPLDSFVLNRNNFCVRSFWHYNLRKRNKDCHFMGAVKGCFKSAYWNFDTTIDDLPDNFYKDKRWLENQKKFFKCELNDSNFQKYDVEYYIDHYRDSTWTRGSKSFTQLDVKKV